MGAQQSTIDNDEEAEVELEDLGCTFVTMLDLAFPVPPGRAYVFVFGGHAVWAGVCTEGGRPRVRFSSGASTEEQEAARALIRSDIYGGHPLVTQ